MVHIKNHLGFISLTAFKCKRLRLDKKKKFNKGRHEKPCVTSPLFFISNPKPATFGRRGAVSQKVKMQHVVTSVCPKSRQNHGY